MERGSGFTSEIDMEACLTEACEGLGIDPDKADENLFDWTGDLLHGIDLGSDAAVFEIDTTDYTAGRDLPKGKVVISLIEPQESSDSTQINSVVVDAREDRTLIYQLRQVLPSYEKEDAYVTGALVVLNPQREDLRRSIVQRLALVPKFETMAAMARARTEFEEHLRIRLGEEALDAGAPKANSKRRR